MKQGPLFRRYGCVDQSAAGYAGATLLAFASVMLWVIFVGGGQAVAAPAGERAAVSVDDPAWWLAQAIEAADRIDPKSMRAGEWVDDDERDEWVTEARIGLLIDQARLLTSLRRDEAAVERLQRAWVMVGTLSDDEDGIDWFKRAVAAMAIQAGQDELAGRWLADMKETQAAMARLNGRLGRALILGQREQAGRHLDALLEAIGKIEEDTERDWELYDVATMLWALPEIEYARRVTDRISDLDMRLEVSAYLAIVDFRIHRDGAAGLREHQRLLELEKRAVAARGQKEDDWDADSWAEDVDAAMASLELVLNLPDAAARREQKIEYRALKAQVEAFRAWASELQGRPVSERLRHAEQTHRQLLRSAREEMDDTMLMAFEAWLIYRTLAKMDEPWNEAQLRQIGILEGSRVIPPWQKAGVYTFFADGLLQQRRLKALQQAAER